MQTIFFEPEEVDALLELLNDIDNADWTEIERECWKKLTEIRIKQNIAYSKLKQANYPMSRECYRHQHEKCSRENGLCSCDCHKEKSSENN